MHNRKWSLIGTTRQYLWLCIGLALGSMILSGCGSVKYGSLKYSPEANKMFEDLKILAEIPKLSHRKSLNLLWAGINSSTILHDMESSTLVFKFDNDF